MPVEMRANFVVDDDDTTAGQLSGARRHLRRPPWSCSSTRASGITSCRDAPSRGTQGDTCHEAGRKSFPFLTMVRHQLVEPLDYEQFVSKNKTILPQ
ncbi:hypothetical protein MTO96_046396 [Rhipicephalus appendiculatus]